MVRNIQKTLETWCQKYNSNFGFSSSSWNGATVRETSSYTDRPHIAIGMTSKNLNEVDWMREKELISMFFPRFFEIDFSMQKALIFIDDRSDES
ncbi:MAG: hypothetical protein LBH98_04415 [Chitinispirillales bacterium]|jgi:hypothetical protein|nr:hypothetical protein [Chitinispirillales bacterium]